MLYFYNIKDRHYKFRKDGEGKRRIGSSNPLIYAPALGHAKDKEILFLFIDIFLISNNNAIKLLLNRHARIISMQFIIFLLGLIICTA